jgi:hypothetical protein
MTPHVGLCLEILTEIYYEEMNPVQSAESRQTFWRNSQARNRHEANNNQSFAEVGGGKIFRNVG